jgi:ATP-dependent DNA helicase PIF1
MDKLNQKQTDAIIAIKNGKNVFLTGPAGSGKSYVINQVRKIYGKRASITSTTGISAIQLSGKTIHSWAGIGLGDKSVNFLVKEIKKTKAMCRWKYSRMLVIDEISMLAPSVFDKLNEIGQILRNNKLPFGGIQLVLCGDFLQLPVIDSADFCFESKYWDSTIDTTIYLDKIIRQQDTTFASILEKARLGKCTQKMKDVFLSRVGLTPTFEDGILPTRLYSKNIAVDVINQTELDKLPGEIVAYQAKLQKSGSVSPYLEASLLKHDRIIELKVGAQVMLSENIDVDSGFGNGSRGVIINFIDGLPLVKFKTGLEKIIDEFERKFESDDYCVIKRQVPLRLAWAITIHKSQGLSLDFVITSLERDDIFEYSMAYVALSRVKTLDGLFLDGFSRRSLRCHPKALLFYQNLLNNSDNSNDNNDNNDTKASVNGNLNKIVQTTYTFD